MEVNEIFVKVYLLKDITKEQSLEKISEFLDKSLSFNDRFLEFHNSNKYKNYTFNSLYKLEKDGIYKEGSLYTVKIRTIDKSLLEYFKNTLANEYTEYIKGLTVKCNLIKRRHIEKLYSITPVVLKTSNGYWRGNLSFEDFERRIRENLIKKYNCFFNTKLDEEFELFHRIEFNNRKPISSNYKNIKILGDKLTLHIAENDNAQKLAYFALGTGIGEMNSRGFGYVNYKAI